MNHNSIIKNAGVIAIIVVITFICTAFTIIGTYNTKASFLAVDNFGNFYTAANNRVLKFSNEGKYLFPYEEFKYGKIGMIDVTNPMKMLVYYPDFQTVVTLDKFLSPLSIYKFFDLGYQNIAAVGSSTDGNLWFYDNVDFKLKKIDETGKVFRESQPLNLLIEETPSPNFILERDNTVYINDPVIGILVFDFFGAYKKTIPLKGLKRFQVLQQQIVYFDENELKSYNTVTFDSKSLPLPDTTSIIHAVLQNERIALLKPDRVDFYKY